MGFAIRAATGSGLGDRIPKVSVRNERGCASASCILDDAYQLLSAGQIKAGMDLLMCRLSELRNAPEAEGWETFCRAEAMLHPVGALVWQDPLTAHSFNKPRGYSGDAQLLDYIYGNSPVPPDTSDLGRAIFQHNINRQAPSSVRSRRDILARAIDETVAQFPSPRILSVACGHLREVEGSKEVMEGRVGEFVALDQDPQSLAEVERAYGSKGVRTVQHSVRAILTEKAIFRDFHLVYAAGLYDYLSERVATRLTRLMFDMLAPGGRLLIANFAPCLADIGYIETYMAWKLIYRESEQMTALARDIASSEWKSHRLFWDEHESIIFLEITKRSARKGSISFAPGAKQAAVPGLKNVTTTPEVGSRPRRERPQSGNGDGNGRANSTRTDK